MVRTFRNDCLDHLIVLNERHLWALLREYVEYYNTHRPHRSLALRPPTPDALPRAGPVVSRAVLGGLHHSYERAAWRPEYCRPTTHPGRTQAPMPSRRNATI